MAFVPLPHTCQHHAFIPGGVADDHGNAEPGWADPVPRRCFWQAGSSTEPRSTPTGGDLVTVDLTLVLDVSTPVDHRDRFTVAGRQFEVVGLPYDADHGPFGFKPGVLVLELKWVG